MKPIQRSQPRVTAKPKPDAYDVEQIQTHFGNYAEYSRTLRAWLVAYGIGAPVLFFTNETASAKVATSSHARSIIGWFLLGVSLQIVLALINKWSAWHMYAGAYDEAYQARRRYKFWDWVNNQSWFDFAIDVASICSFVYATWRVLSVVLEVAPK